MPTGLLKLGEEISQYLKRLPPIIELTKNEAQEPAHVSQWIKDGTGDSAQYNDITVIVG
jgi:hypothetical protein